MDNTLRAFFSDTFFLLWKPGLCQRLSYYHRTSCRCASDNASEPPGGFIYLRNLVTHTPLPPAGHSRTKSCSLTTKSSCLHRTTRADAHGSQQRVINTFSISTGPRAQREKMTQDQYLLIGFLTHQSQVMVSRLTPRQKWPAWIIFGGGNIHLSAAASLELGHRPVRLVAFLRSFTCWGLFQDLWWFRF